jgi:hypothetical protein
VSSSSQSSSPDEEMFVDEAHCHAQLVAALDVLVALRFRRVELQQQQQQQSLSFAHPAVAAAEAAAVQALVVRLHKAEVRCQAFKLRARAELAAIGEMQALLPHVLRSPVVHLGAAVSTVLLGGVGTLVSLRTGSNAAAGSYSGWVRFWSHLLGVRAHKCKQHKLCDYLQQAETLAAETAAEAAATTTTAAGATLTKGTPTQPQKAGGGDSKHPLPRVSPLLHLLPVLPVSSPHLLSFVGAFALSLVKMSSPEMRIVSLRQFNARLKLSDSGSRNRSSGSSSSGSPWVLFASAADERLAHGLQFDALTLVHSDLGVCMHAFYAFDAEDADTLSRALQHVITVNARWDAQQQQQQHPAAAAAATKYTHKRVHVGAESAAVLAQVTCALMRRSTRALGFQNTNASHASSMVLARVRAIFDQHGVDDDEERHSSGRLAALFPTLTVAERSDPLFVGRMETYLRHQLPSDAELAPRVSLYSAAPLAHYNAILEVAAPIWADDAEAAAAATAASYASSVVGAIAPVHQITLPSGVAANDLSVVESIAPVDEIALPPGIAPPEQDNSVVEGIAPVHEIELPPGVCPLAPQSQQQPNDAEVDWSQRVTEPGVPSSEFDLAAAAAAVAADDEDDWRSQPCVPTEEEMHRMGRAECRE